LRLQLLLDRRSLARKLAAADVDRIGQRITRLGRAVRLDRSAQRAQFGFKSFDLGYQPFHLLARGLVAVIERDSRVYFLSCVAECVAGHLDGFLVTFCSKA